MMLNKTFNYGCEEIRNTIFMAPERSIHPVKKSLHAEKLTIGLVSLGIPQNSV